MMSAYREYCYWRTNKEWYRINWEKECYELTDKAPERAIKSFELYLERKRILNKMYSKRKRKLNKKKAK